MHRAVVLPIVVVAIQYFSLVVMVATTNQYLCEVPSSSSSSSSSLFIDCFTFSNRLSNINHSIKKKNQSIPQSVSTITTTATKTRFLFRNIDNSIKNSNEGTEDYTNNDNDKKQNTNKIERRTVLQQSSIISLALLINGGVVPAVVNAAAAVPESATGVQATLDIDTFLRTGIDTGGGMTVSSQTGKSKPITGVIFRDGTDITQDSTTSTGTGIVTAEIVTGTKTNPCAYIIQFTSPQYKLESKSTIFDIECRNTRTGDTIFVTVSEPFPSSTIESVSQSILLNRLFSPTGRFSSYGTPTDIKVRKDYIVTENDTKKRYLDISFASLAQSTNTEILRHAIVASVLVPYSSSGASTTNEQQQQYVAVQLVGSTTGIRWKKDIDTVQSIMYNILSTFTVIPSPKTNMKIRSKDRYNNRDIF